MDLRRLIEEGRRFLSKLPRRGRILVVADNDTDGIVSAHLFARYYHRKNPYASILIVITPRERLLDILREYPSYTPVILDITPPEEVMEYLGEGGLRAFVIDHHPCSCRGPLIVFNPHLLDLPHASRYNTGFLVYLLFRDEIVKSGDLWKVAVSSFGDSSFDFLSPHFYGLDKRTVELASHMVGSVDEESLSLVFSALEEAKTIDDFVSNEELLRMKEEFEKTLKRIIDNAEKYTVEEGRGLLVLLLPPELARFKSAVATVISKRRPDVLVAVGVEDDNVYNFSLRLQSAREKGIHLGYFAQELAGEWGTRGGGHAPASGVRVPKNRLDEFILKLKELLKVSL